MPTKSGKTVAERVRDVGDGRDEIERVLSDGVGLLNTDALNNGRSGRFGDTVYYSTQDSGPYTDGADAYEDVPPGGTLLLGDGNYDAATEGRLVSTVPKNIRGLGWGYDADNGYSGTVLVNTGEDSIDAPMIDFDGTETGASNDFISGPTVRDLFIQHDSPSAAAVHYNDAPHSVTENVRISGGATAKHCLHYENDSFLGYAQSVRAQDSDGQAVLVDSPGGYGYTFDTCFFRSDNDAGLEARLQNIVTIGGQFTGDVGLRLSQQSDRRMSNSYIISPTFEACQTTSLEFDDLTPTDNLATLNNHVLSPRFITKPDYHIQFIDSADSVVHNPYFEQPATVVDVRWGGDSVRDGIIGTKASIPDGIEVDGGFEPWMTFNQPMKNALVDTIPTDPDLNVSVCYNPVAGGPVWHDGADWYVASGSTFTP